MSDLMSNKKIILTDVEINAIKQNKDLNLIYKEYIDMINGPQVDILGKSCDLEENIYLKISESNNVYKDIATKLLKGLDFERLKYLIIKYKNRNNKYEIFEQQALQILTSIENNDPTYKSAVCEHFTKIN